MIQYITARKQPEGEGYIRLSECMNQERGAKYWEKNTNTKDWFVLLLANREGQYAVMQSSVSAISLDKCPPVITTKPVSKCTRD